ncbi:MAG: NADH dehydrogenase (quinone) subunit G [Acidobacteria bacterium]|nr:MAG: NADH dehydrogenase (quinone) subunit G [Acidobacteriota bacterium]
MADVTITVDGKKVTAPAGTLLIEACKSAGVEVPAFCYYPGLSVQGACRMCLVRIEKMPKLQTACTVPITDGMIVITATPEVHQARKATVEILLGNHPLDCPVCDAGGECELQDMTFAYGAAESQYMESKQHKEEQQWSPVVFFDRPRCILCYRCVRVCGEGMDVWALGVQNRGVASLIAPNKQDHLECEECGMCIDICPVGALTSGAYRYKTRPWEMNHVGTICTHCADGCKTTLGVRRSKGGMEIVRGDNRDKSGINGDFLCIKGRYAFDFANSDDRITQPLVRRDGKLMAVSWEQAIDHVANRFKQIRDSQGGGAIGVIGSNRTTNEENYLLQKFARSILGTNNIDHHQTADYPAFAKAVAGKQNITATLREVTTAPAVLLIGNDPTEQHPLLAWNLRTNVRIHNGRIYIVNSGDIKLRRQARAYAQVPMDGGESLMVRYLGGDDSVASQLQSSSLSRDLLREFRDKVKGEKELIIVFGSELRGDDVFRLVKWGSAQSAKFICLGDYSNSRGAADMGLYPHLLPGFTPVSSNSAFAQEYGSLMPGQAGLDIQGMFSAAKSGKLGALYIVGSNPVARYNIDPFALKNTCIVVQDLFLTETATIAEVFLPAANAYEKAGTYSNTYGDLQLLKKAGDLAGVRTDFELIVRIADRMGADVHKLVPFGKGIRADMGQSRGAQSGEADQHLVWLSARNLEPKLSPFDPEALLDEIQRLVPGYNFSRLNLFSGGDVHTLAPEFSSISQPSSPESIVPANDTLFTSGTLGRYSNTLNSVIENRQATTVEAQIPAD